MKATAILAGAAALAVAGGASAEVSTRSDRGFTLSFERPVTASPDKIFAALGQPGEWWSDAHTYSGDASNLRLDLRPGGCWCEDLPGGGVKHAEAVLVWPEQRMVRFDAPLGPLQSIGARAVLTMTWADGESGADRRLKWTFVVDGDGAGLMADAVDGVLAAQFDRLVQRLGSD